ncbi:sigma-70 family RNA polymerase sigma factor [Kitasatospora sp. NPDC049258]|uniref:RNA polymerase sigma factor n=1 Tax=Kitasatospora sp. NPDC049258 TaxID=3155394 RepID=UPI0034486211
MPRHPALPPERGRAVEGDPALSSPVGGGYPGEQVAESDEWLTERVRAGDESVVTQLYERHHPAAVAYARTLTRTRESAEDLASEAFALTLAAVRTGDGPSQSWRQYLLTVIRNTARAWALADRRTQLTSDFGAWVDRQDQALSPDELLMAAAERDLVADAYLVLPERWRTALWHVVVEQQTPEAVAPILGLTASGVSSLVSRAREGLREAYLAAHVRRAGSLECAAYAAQIGALVRRPDKRRGGKLARHLQDCAECQSCFEEMKEVNGRLRAAAIAAFVPPTGHE